MPAARRKRLDDTLDADVIGSHDYAVSDAASLERQKRLADECLRNVKLARTEHDLIKALDVVTALRGAISKEATESSRTSAIFDPISGLTLPIPAPIHPFKDREKRWRLTTEDLDGMIAKNWQPWRDNKILFLEDVFRADRQLYKAIWYQAEANAMRPHYFAFEKLAILSARVIETNSGAYRRQAVLLKALALLQSGNARIESAHAAIAKLGR